MINADILAQILGISFLFVSLSMIFNRKATSIAIDKITNDSALIWVLGFFSILIGSTIMAFTNFNNGLNKFIYIIGILSLLKGIYLLSIPEHSTNLYKKIVKNKISIPLFGFIFLLLSIFLIIKGL